MMLDHMAKPDAAIKNSPWYAQMYSMSRLPHVYCKLAPFLDFGVTQNIPEDTLIGFLCHAIECFGFDRLVYGSDLPLGKNFTDNADFILAIIKATEKMGGGKVELEKIFKTNAELYYRITDSIHPDIAEAVTHPKSLIKGP
jgi:L-fuconolactonase